MVLQNDKWILIPKPTTGRLKENANSQVLNSWELLPLVTVKELITFKTLVMSKSKYRWTVVCQPLKSHD